MRMLPIVTSALGLVVCLPTVASAQAPRAPSLDDGKVYVLEATPDGPKSQPLFESLLVSRLPRGDYRFSTPARSGVTLHGMVHGDQVRAVTEGPGDRFAFVGVIDAAGDARGRFSVTGDGKTLGTGNFTFSAPVSARLRSCDVAHARAGWKAEGGVCKAPAIAQATGPSQTGGENLWQSFCASDESHGLCDPIHYLSTVSWWAQGQSIHDAPSLSAMAPAQVRSVH